ncbi:MAG: topoisomerase [Phototrophicales bacterium]|nr:MAG: topoisomerase [Phototrophicales bacterium]
MLIGFIDAIVRFIIKLLFGERISVKEITPEFPYYLRDHFLSAAELNFYAALCDTVGEYVTICCKVGLQDIFYVKKSDYSLWRTYTNKIDRKHVDFLLCDPTTMQPLVGVELDDSSHQRKDRQERDEFVNAVFDAAGLPLVHIPVRRFYRQEDILRQIGPYLGEAAQLASPSSETTENTSENPSCPKCGSVMVLRIARRGDYAGRRFWGCSNYPDCRGTLSLEERP